MPKQLTPQRLHRAMSNGFRRVENFRKARLMFLDEYVGAFYDRSNPTTANPVNLMFKAVSILTPHLVATNPAFQVDPRYLQFKRYAHVLQLATDQWCRDNRYKETLRMAIVDAIFGLGIVKTGLTIEDKMLDIDQAQTNLTTPFADRVDLDDFCVDPQARHTEETIFEGNRIRVPRQWMLESGLFDNRKVEKLPGVGDSQQTYRGQKEAWTMSIGKNQENDINELVDYVDLVELWIRDEQRVVIMPYNESMYNDEFLRVVDWEGRDEGPYHYLGFHWVPNNFFPVAPAGIWYDLHIMMNKLAAKAARQADRQKTQGLYRKSDSDDATNVIEGNDGEWIGVDDPQAFQTVEWGGVNENLYEHMQWIDVKFQESGPGDFQQLGGEASEADTATQANILQQAASVRISDMTDIIYDFATEIGKDIAWYLHTDPLIEMPLTYRDEAGEERQLIYTPEIREGRFLDYTFSIKHKSMQRPDEEQEAQKWTQAVNTVVPTAIQAFQAFGPMFNPVKFITLMFRKMNLDTAEIQQVWNDPDFQRQYMMMQQMMTQQLGMQQAGVADEGAGQGMGGGGMFGGQQSMLQGGGGRGNESSPIAPGMQNVMAQAGSAGQQPGNGNTTGRAGVSTAGA